MTKLRLGRSMVMLVALVALSVVLFGCAQTAEPTAPASAPKAAAPAGSPTQAPAAAQPAGSAPSEIVIGVLYPLSGSAATAGLDTKYGVDLAAKIVNGEFDFGMPLAKAAGLPNLGGAKVKLVAVDHQGLPEKGQSEAERLITQEGAVALFGAYHSSVTQTASQTAERLGIPFVNGESSSPALTERGLKTFFRTGPHDITYAEGLFNMLDELKQRGENISTIATVNENTLAGSDASKVSERIGKERGYETLEHIAYPGNTSEVTSEVQRLKAANPDVVFQLSYTSDAVLFVNTYRQLDFNPQGVLAFGSGFVDPKFTEIAGKSAEYMISRAAWSSDIAEKNPMAKAVRDMFHADFNQDMTENSARAFTGMITLLDAIDRAKTTEPQPILDALRATDIPGDQLIMPWKGVKFDANGQNTEIRTINMQVFDGKYYTVYPFDVAAKEIVWPRPAWSEIK